MDLIQRLRGQGFWRANRIVRDACIRGRDLVITKGERDSPSATASSWRRGSPDKSPTGGDAASGSQSEEAAEPFAFLFLEAKKGKRGGSTGIKSHRRATRGPPEPGTIRIRRQGECRQIRTSTSTSLLLQYIAGSGAVSL